jgi:hypothetical protein
MLRILALAALLLVSALSPRMCTATTLKEIKVGIRVLDFVNGPPPAEHVLGIIYNPQNRQSVEDAQSIQGWISSGLTPSKVQWTPVLMDVRRLAEAQPVPAAILASGTSGDFEDLVFHYARRQRVLTITSDMDCVVAGKCVVGVAAEPRVEVVVSRSAAAACGVVFSDAFRMMVLER